MQGPQKLKVRPETVLGVHPEVLEAIGKVIDRIVTDLDEINYSMDVISLYFERRGIKEELFTEEELREENGEAGPSAGPVPPEIPGVPGNDK